MNLYKSYGISLPFVAAGMLFLLIRLISVNSLIEVNFFETYYIVSKSMMTMGLVVAMFCFALVYQIFSWIDHPLNTKLGMAHFLVTLLGATILASLPAVDMLPGDYQKMRQNMDRLSLFCLIGSGIFCFGQLILALNIARTFFYSINPAGKELPRR